VGLNGVRASAARGLLTAYLEILDAINASGDPRVSHVDAACEQIAQVIRLLSSHEKRKS
jgi:hypothetical protein